uniref:Si:dkey-25g12.4 n=1 Tax=Amphiprion percula TaxID=161767 RepID=A0A3P8U0X1_AMPPE
MAAVGDLPPTKTIIVYRNGDAFCPGRKLVVNPRQLSTFDSFLTFLTRAIEAPFGAVRRLYTPRQGHRVQHMDDLKHGSVYVAAGNEHFKKLENLSGRSAHVRGGAPPWAEACIAACGPAWVVFTNGDILATPVRIRVPKYTRKSWESVLAMVTEKVCLRTGAVFRLCTLDGRPVCGPSELENNQHYVAVGTEKFKALPYDQCVPCRELVKKNNVIEGYEPCNVLSINYVLYTCRINTGTSFCCEKGMRKCVCQCWFYFSSLQPRHPAFYEKQRICKGYGECYCFRVGCSGPSSCTVIHFLETC